MTIEPVLRPADLYSDDPDRSGIGHIAPRADLVVRLATRWRCPAGVLPTISESARADVVGALGTAPMTAALLAESGRVPSESTPSSAAWVARGLSTARHFEARCSWREPKHPEGVLTIEITRAGTIVTLVDFVGRSSTAPIGQTQTRPPMGAVDLLRILRAEIGTRDAVLTAMASHPDLGVVEAWEQSVGFVWTGGRSVVDQVRMPQAQLVPDNTVPAVRVDPFVCRRKADLHDEASRWLCQVLQDCHYGRVAEMVELTEKALGNLDGDAATPSAT